MKFVKKVLAGLLLSFGFLFILVAVAAIVGKDANDRENRFLGGLALGVPSTVAGIWLVRGLSLQNQLEKRDRLQSAFFKLLKQGDGRVTTLVFAMETKLSGETAKAYLDERAKEFNADFDVNEEGDLSYRFNIGSLNLPQAKQLIPEAIAVAQGTFDVILETVPNNCKIQAIKVVRELTHLGLKEAKDLVEATPIKLRAGISEAVAQDCQRKLEAIGATVMVIAN